MASCGSGPTLGKEEDLAIISGVLDGVKQSFVDEGVDPVILEQLQQLWVSKLTRLGGPGLGIRDVLTPPSDQTQEDELQLEAGEGAEEGEEGASSVVSSDLLPPAPSSSGARPKIKKLRKKVTKIIQVDGPADSSDEEDGLDDDDDGDDDDDDDDDDLDPDGEEDDEGVEEDPLGSEDDISDEDASDLFETDNVVVCQYDKITRARNKWKFHLKDGIMNLNGKDYVFQRANGDAEW